MILKRVVLMFIQQSQMLQINQCVGDTANVCRNIRNVFKNHITVIEKNYIAKYIDTEVFSSPKFKLDHFLKHIDIFVVNNSSMQVNPQRKISLPS